MKLIYKNNKLYSPEQNYKHHNLFSLPNIIRTNTSRRQRWPEYVACLGYLTTVYGQTKLLGYRYLCAKLILNRYYMDKMWAFKVNCSDEV
jgi:hypothetical protein